MFAPNCVRSLNARAPRKVRKTPTWLKPAGAQSCEPLERRQLLSTVTVSNASPDVNGDTSSIAALIANPGPDGISFAEAVQAANNTPGANTIVFPSSFSGQSIYVVNVSITGDITIQGPADGSVIFNGPDPLLQSGGGGGGGGRILDIAAGATVNLSNATLQNGDATVAWYAGDNDHGGAILNAGNLTVTQCQFYNNAAGDKYLGTGGGGAIYNTGALTVMGSSFYFDAALWGNGGGIDNAGSASIVNSTFLQNTCGDLGGAIGNEAGHSITVTNCTLVQNGGIPDSFPLLDLPQGLGGIGNYGTMTLNNTIVSDSSCGTDVENDGVLTGTHNLIKDGSGTGLTSTVTGDPMLAAPVFRPYPSPFFEIPTPEDGGDAFTLEPLAGSPAINAGDNSAVISASDERGVPRINGTVDIGAVETGAFTVVVTTLTDENNGSVDPALGTGTSLREALSFAVPEAETITFAPGLAGSILLNTALSTPTPGYFPPSRYGGQTIIGGGKITLDGQGKTSIMDAGLVTISGVTFANGAYEGSQVNQSGGAFTGGNATLTDCLFVNNSTRENGGAIFSNGNLTVTDCTFSNNSAGQLGGAIYETDNACDVFADCAFTGNTAAEGGALCDFSYNLNEPNIPYTIPVFSGCTFTANSATDMGGAIFIIDDVDFSNQPSELELINCTIVNNSAANNGGGILDSGMLHMYDSTVFGNYVTNPASGSLIGAGIARVIAPLDDPNAFPNPGETTLNNDIIAGNIGGADLVFDNNGTDSLNGSYNLIGDGSGGLPHTITGNPLLGPLQNNGGPTPTMALLPGSPAIDAGSNGLAVDDDGHALTTDQRGTGFGRIVNGTVDIGAFESSGFTIATTGGSNQSTAAGTAFASPLGVQVTPNHAGDPVAGGVITFTAPAFGASATFSGNPITLDANGAGSVTATADSTAGGPYTVNAAASGIASPAPFTLTNAIGAASGTTSTVSAQPNSIVAGSASTVTLTAKDASGNKETSGGLTVVFGLGSGVGQGTFGTVTDNGDGTYAAAFTGTIAGSNTITATINGTAVTSTAPITITAATPSITTAAEPTTTPFGSPIADQATVSGGFSPTGTVTFNLYLNASAIGTPLFTDTETLSGGVATSKGFTPTTTGTYYWVATYNGDPGNASTTSNPAAAPATVNQATPRIGVADAGGTYNGSSFPATVTLAGVNGPVTSLEGVSPTLTYYAGSSASGSPLSGAPIDAGTYTVVANFAGSADYTVASASMTFTIAAAGTSMTLKSDAPTGATPGQDVTFTATVASLTPAATTPAGTIQFNIDGIAYQGPVTLNNGVATISDAALQIGSHAVTATFISGSSNFNGSTTAAALTQAIGKYSAVLSNLSAPTIIDHTHFVTLGGNVSGSSSTAATPTGNVTISASYAGKVVASQTIGVSSNGSFAATFLSISANVGQYTLSYSYGGDANYAAVTETTIGNVTYGIRASTPSKTKAGSTLTATVILTDAFDKNVSSPSTTITATGIAPASSPDAISPLPAGNSPQFSYAKHTYTLNLETTGLKAGAYLLYFTVSGDSVVHSLQFVLN